MAVLFLLSLRFCEASLFWLRQPLPCCFCSKPHPSSFHFMFPKQYQDSKANALNFEYECLNECPLSSRTHAPQQSDHTFLSCRPAVNGWSCQDIQPGNVVAWPTNLGWMMGPWLIYATLLNRAAIGLFLGAPTGRPFCEFVAHARVTMLGVVPSIVKAWRVSDCTAGLDWSAIRCFSSSGEVCLSLHSACEVPCC